MPGYKQVIVLRSDIDMSKGKSIAQACHASLKAFERAPAEARDSWNSSGCEKVVLKADDLESLKGEADNADLPCYLVTDAGRTELEPGTVTALGIGPAEESKIDSITGYLPLVS